MREEPLEKLMETLAETAELDSDETQLIHELLNEAYNAGHAHGEARIQSELDEARKGFEQYRTCIKSAMAWPQ